MSPRCGSKRPKPGRDRVKITHLKQTFVEEVPKQRPLSMSVIYFVMLNLLLYLKKKKKKKRAKTTSAYKGVLKFFGLNQLLWAHACAHVRARAHTHTHTHTHTHPRACACRSGIFEMFNIRRGHFGVFNSQRHVPLTALLYSLYWPWGPLSSLESTPVSMVMI